MLLRASRAHLLALIAGLIPALLLPSVSTHAFATTQITIDSTGCGTIGGNWVDPVCTLNQDYTLDSGNQILVPAGNELVVNSILTDNGEIFANSPNLCCSFPGGTITIGLNGLIIVNKFMTANYHITNHGELLVADNGELINNGGGKVTNTGFLAVTALGTILTKGELNNTGTLKSLGAILNTNTGTLHNTGTFLTSGSFSTLQDFENHGTFGNFGNMKILNYCTTNGTFSNSGNITVGQDAIFSNEKSGTFFNNAGGVIFGGVGNDGTLENSGTIGAGASATTAPGIGNSGAATNKGTIIGGVENIGTFNNNQGGSIYINGTFLALPNEFLTDGVFNNNGGKITVSSYMENNLFATFNNHGSLTNLPGSRIDNLGVMNNAHVTFFPIINNSGTFNNYAKAKFVNDVNGTVVNGASGTFDNFVDSSFLNSGTFYDIGSLALNGNATNKAAGSIYTAHACPNCVSAVNGGVFTNNGLFANVGVADVSGTFDAGIVTNHATFINHGSISNFGTVNNNGALTSTGFIYGVGTWNNNAGKIDNSGLFIVSSNGAINNYALIKNENAGNFTIMQTGTISNNAGATVNNYGSVSNHGTIFNKDSATINNYGTITNYKPGSIINSAHGTLNNYGQIISDDVATFTNYGLTDNFGTIINEPTDSVLNYGTLDIESGASLFNYGSLDNGAGGVISNSGSIYNEPGGSISGSISGNPTVAIPSPFVSDGSFCPLPNNQTRLSYVQDMKSGPAAYKLVSSNPGQDYYNVFFVSGLNSSAGTQFTLSIPYPYVTKGAVPVQVFENQQFPSCGSNLPESNINSMLTISPSKVTLANYGASPAIGITTLNVTVTLNSPLPAGTVLWFTVHLDYGLKGYDFTKDTSGNVFGVASTPSFNPIKEIANGQAYNFSYAAPIISQSISINSVDRFNK